MRQLGIGLLATGLSFGAFAAHASDDRPRDASGVRVEGGAGPNFFYASGLNAAAGLSYVPHPVVAIGLSGERPGYGTALYATLLVAPFGARSVSPYVVGGRGRQWYGGVARGATTFLGAGFDVRISSRISAFAEARVHGLAYSGSDADPVGNGRVGFRLRL